MAKKLIGGVGKALGVGKKKKPAASTATADTAGGPVVKPLLVNDPNWKRLKKAPFGPPVGSVLGGFGTLGG